MRHHLWVQQAIQKIVADGTRSADTHLLKVEWPAAPYIQWYLKDESTHITGSLKHRLARALFLYGLCNRWIRHNTPLIEASSGSTAVSEAYFARLLGLPFVAVMPKNTSASKMAQGPTPWPKKGDGIRYSGYKHRKGVKVIAIIDNHGSV